MKHKILTAVCISLFFSHATHAQNPFLTKEFVDINKIKASVMVHGDMWWNPTTTEQECEFPKGSGKHASHAGGLWVSGYSNIGDIHASTCSYRDKGVDYWPGISDVGDPLNIVKSTKWARIWKVNLTDINTFKSTSTHTEANTPAAILEWPAKNNLYAKGNNGIALTITRDMAPFVDVDKDGSYDPLKGDYPEIKGDQMLWWVFSDNGPTHYNQVVPMQLEVQARAYAYNRGNAVDNMIFYEYDITNKSNLTYDSCTFSIWTGADLGFFNDDFLGFDSSRRLGFVYNGKKQDGSGQLNAYGDSPPVMGIALLEAPGDNATKQLSAGSFMYYNNDMTVRGYPANAVEYINYQHHSFRDGTLLKNDFAGPTANSTGMGSGPLARYVFSGDPYKNNEWSECATNNAPQDVNMILSAEDFKFMPQATAKFAFALVITDTSSNNVCPLNLAGIKTLADTALAVYYRQPVTSVKNLQSNLQQLEFYPNPAHDKLYIEHNTTAVNERVKVCDVTGRTVSIATTIDANKMQLDISPLNPGVYNIYYQNEQELRTAVFVKE